MFFPVLSVTTAGIQAFPLALVIEAHVPCLSAQGTREEDDVVSEDLVHQDVQVNKHWGRSPRHSQGRG